ncbi:MAG TPA: amidohydrolase family protein, partial [Bryobacteraceae bacterium]|nr:amidohydrolase family protein [Bryobacteraceae bacterium]
MKILTALLFLSVLGAQSPDPYDVVIAGGRVMDPESRLDAVRHIGIRGGKIAAISEQSLTGKTVLQAAGRVVAPGFIDLHSHGQTNASNEYQAHDGVTTALELEVGVPSVGAFLRSRENRAILNFGATSSHGAMRVMAMRAFASEAAGSRNAPESWHDLAMKGRYKHLTTPEEFSVLAATMERGLREGGLGLGVATQYYPGATREEVFRVFQMARRWKVPIFTHVRSMTPDAMQEVIADAAATGVSLHIVHVNSMSLGSLPFVLDLIDSACKAGLDITTEAYPYTAASTYLESTMFDDGWQERLGISYGELQWVKTGERLNQETFERYRKEGGVVIMHLM